METVAFYSYKGGVGRTLLVANTAQFLAISGRRVVAIDLDLEAPGLHEKLGTPETLDHASSGKLGGVVDELLGRWATKPKKSKLREIAIEVDLPVAPGGCLTLLPAGSAPSRSYWEKLAQLGKSISKDHLRAGLPEAMLELKAQIEEDFAPDFLLIDSRTGVTQLGGLATSILADRVVCMTTTAPESVNGTQVVAEALRAAPRLPSQRALEVSFLITRVPFESTQGSNVTQLVKELGGAVAIFPHDSLIANKEQVLSDWRIGSAGGDDEYGRTDHKLFGATLDWIAESFPGHKQAAEATRRRMSAVHDAWHDLTRTSERVRGGTRGRRAWPLEQLRERERFGEAKRTRQADIAIYPTANSGGGDKPLMIVEYVENEDRDAVARWWIEELRVPVVAILSEKGRRLYSSEMAWSLHPHHSDRWDLPLPHDFEALSDPTDISIESMLDAVRRGHSQYLPRLVTEWVRCSASGLHGGAPWKPKIAKRIIDGLARVDDADQAMRVLWAASSEIFSRGMWLGDGDEYLEEQVVGELFYPLIWRSLPEAAIEVMKGHGRRRLGNSRGGTALALLARNMLGLQYDPDASFRKDAQHVLDRTDNQSDDDQDTKFYDLIPAFRHTEISFEFSSDAPPIVRGDVRDEDTARRVKDIGDIVADRISSNTLVTTGLLGNYLPTEGRVVLYDEAIRECADRLALRARHVGSVTLIHESIHALIHLARDLDGKAWAEFALPDASNSLFEPSSFHEAVTQYFTYRHIQSLDDPAMLRAFETMSARQAPAYRSWKRIRDLPIEDARNWLMSIRRGIGGIPRPWNELLADGN